MLSAENTSCATAQVIQPGIFEVDSFAGNGAIFQGATAAAWFVYEPTENGIFKVSSCQGGADTRLVIFLLNNCEQPNQVQIINSAEDNCEDGNGGSTASILEVVAVPGIPYYIYWDNAQSEDGFSWELSFLEDTPNVQGDNCSTAIPINEGTHTVDTLTGSGTAFTDAVSAKWYEFIPDRSGSLSINACESAVNTRLFVWENSCGLQQIVAQDDDSCGESGASSLSNVQVIAAETYYIYWDDHYTKSGFTFELSLADSIISSTQEPIWAASLNVFPNPAKTQLFVAYQFDEPKDIQVKVMSYLGQNVYTTQWRNFFAGEIGIDLNGLPVGLYFLQLGSENELVVRPFSIVK